MGMERKTKRANCPFRNDRVCSTKCTFYRKGYIIREEKSEPEPFESCAFNIIADNLEAMYNRGIMLQKEVAQTKNVMALGMLSNIGRSDPEETKQKLIRIIDTTKSDQPLIEDKT